MRLPVALLLTLGACDQVLGLEERASPPDAPPVLVTGSVLRRYVTNDATGSPEIVVEVHPPGTLSMAYTIADARRVEVPVGADGTFSFPRPDAETPYRLTVVADGKRTEIQHTVATLAIRNTTIGRPNDQRVPVTTTTLLEFPPTPTPPRVMSTGLWTSTAAAGTANGTYILDWQTAGSLSGRRGLLSSAQHDNLYLADYAVRAGGHSTIGSYLEVRDADVVDGGFHSYVARPLTVASSSLCARLTANRAADVARFVAAVPGHGPAVSDWLITAVPDVTIGPTGGLTLAFHRDTIGATTDATVSFANPIRGSDMLAATNIVSTRPLTYPGAMTIPLASTIRTFVPVTEQMQCSGATDLTSSIAIPGAVMFDGIALGASDDAVITPFLRETLELTWLMNPGPVDRYTTFLYEIFENPDTGFTSSRVIREFVTVEPAATIDANLLVPGNYYLFVLVASTGQPGTRQGDIGLLTYPFSLATTTSGMFRVD